MSSENKTSGNPEVVVVKKIESFQKTYRKHSDTTNTFFCTGKKHKKIKIQKKEIQNLNRMSVSRMLQYILFGYIVYRSNKTPDFYGSPLRYESVWPKLQSPPLKDPSDVPGNFFFHAFPHLTSAQASKLETFA